MTTPPRVALLSTFNQRCGLATYAAFLTSALREQGVARLVLAERSADVLGSDGAEVLRCWSRGRDGGHELPEVLRAHGVGVLHVNHGSFFAVDGWLPHLLSVARGAGVRVVTTFHETASQGAHFGVLARLSDRVLVHNAQNVLELIALNAPAERIECVPHGVFRAAPTDVFEAKLELGWDPARKVVGTFGFTDPHKGLLQLVEAMRRVHRETGAELRVLGGPHPANPHSVSYLEACKRRALELGLERVVHFADAYLPDDVLLRHLRGCDVLAMNYTSAQFETSGAALFALAAGRPIVSSPAPPFDYTEALTFKTTPTFDLPTALTLTLTNPFVARQLLANQRRYEDVAAWDVVAARLARIYQEVAAAPPQPSTDRLHYYHSHPDCIYAEPLQRERVRWLKSKARGRILEIGPANGYVAEFVGAAAAVDINRGRLEAAAALHPSVHFQYGDVVAGLPFQDREFDVVMAPEILEHVEFEEAVTALRECARVGRSVLLTLPNADKPDYDPELVHNVEHRWLVNRESVERLMREAGCPSYDLDVSEGADFYLVEIRADSSVARAQVSEKALRIASQAPRWEGTLHVAVDATALEDPEASRRGPGRYAFHLFDELSRRRPDWRFSWLGRHAQPATPELIDLCNRPHSSYGRSSRLGELRPDVFYLTDPLDPAGDPDLEVLTNTSALVACALPDLAPVVLLDPAAEPLEVLGQARLRRLAFLQRRCDLLFCGSQRTVHDVQAQLRIPLARLRTVHAAAVVRPAEPVLDARPGSASPRPRLASGEFLLTVGQLDPRKNAAAMFLALGSARRTLGRDLQLVLAGPLPPDLPSALAQIAAQSGVPPEALVLAGAVADGVLARLYKGASALLHPSLVGGFGISILEAFGAALPVIAGDDLAQREICGDAALMVRPRSVPDIASAIVRIHADADLRRELSRGGLERQRRFSWARTAEKTATYLAEAVARKRGHLAPSARQAVLA